MDEGTLDIALQEIVRLEGRIEDLEVQVNELLTLVKVRTRPAKVSLVNVCALDETRDSAACEDATVYRYQQGCRGVACVREYRDYYARYRKKGMDVVDPDVDTVG